MLGDVSWPDDWELAGPESTVVRGRSPGSGRESFPDEPLPRLDRSRQATRLQGNGPHAVDQAQGGRPGELRGPGAEADGDQEQPVTLDHPDRGFPPHREAAAPKRPATRSRPKRRLSLPRRRTARKSRSVPSSSPAARAPGDRAGLVEVPPRGRRDRGRNRRRRLHVLAARLLPGRGRQRRRGGRHERRPRADRGRADQGRRGHDDPARRYARGSTRRRGPSRPSPRSASIPTSRTACGSRSPSVRPRWS